MTDAACGVQVLTVREVLAYGVEDRMGARVELEEFAMRALTYNVAEGFTMDDLQEKDRCVLMSDDAHA